MGHLSEVSYRRVVHLNSTNPAFNCTDTSIGFSNSSIKSWVNPMLFEFSESALTISFDHQIIRSHKYSTIKNKICEPAESSEITKRISTFLYLAIWRLNFRICRFYDKTIDLELIHRALYRRVNNRDQQGHMMSQKLIHRKEITKLIHNKSTRSIKTSWKRRNIFNSTKNAPLITNM